MRLRLAVLEPPPVLTLLVLPTYYVIAERFVNWIKQILLRSETA